MDEITLTDDELASLKDGFPALIRRGQFGAQQASTSDLSHELGLPVAAVEGLLALVSS